MQISDAKPLINQGSLKVERLYRGNLLAGGRREPNSGDERKHRRESGGERKLSRRSHAPGGVDGDTLRDTADANVSSALVNALGTSRDAKAETAEIALQRLYPNIQIPGTIHPLRAFGNLQPGSTPGREHLDPGRDSGLTARAICPVTPDAVPSRGVLDHKVVARSSVEQVRTIVDIKG